MDFLLFKQIYEGGQVQQSPAKFHALPCTGATDARHSRLCQDEQSEPRGRPDNASPILPIALASRRRRDRPRVTLHAQPIRWVSVTEPMQRRYSVPARCLIDFSDGLAVPEIHCLTASMRPARSLFVESSPPPTIVLCRRD